MVVNLISRFSFDKQILYLLKIIFANHLQTEAKLKEIWSLHGIITVIPIW